MEKDKVKWVQHYLDGQMNAEEKAQFESQLAQEERLREELALQKDMVGVLKAQEKAALKKELSGQWKAPPTRSARRPLRRWWLTAAAVFLLGAVGLWWFQNTPAAPNRLARTFLEEGYAAPSIVRDQVAETEKNWRLAANAFQNDQFNVAVELIKKEEKLTVEQQFYLGLTYLFMAEPNYPKSIEQLQKVVVSGHIDFTEQATWFLALAYFKNEQTEKAQSYLREIVAGEKWKTAAAQQLLEEMAKEN